MTYLAIIPARMGSKGIPGKNVKLLGGQPLIAFTIDQALTSTRLSKIVISTDDPMVIDIAASYGIEAVHRPSALAMDNTPMSSVISHVAKKFTSFSHLVILQPTSPLRSTDDIDAVINQAERTGCPSVISVTEVKNHPYWTFKKDSNERLLPFCEEIELAKFPTRQSLEKVYALNGAIYCVERSWFMETGKLIGQESLGYEMPLSRSIDIDSPEDWKFAQMSLSSLQTLET